MQPRVCVCVDGQVRAALARRGEPDLLLNARNHDAPSVCVLGERANLARREGGAPQSGLAAIQGGGLKV